MSHPHTTSRISSSTEIHPAGFRHSTKRPRERSISPRSGNATGGDTQSELEPEETLLSFSDLIRPLSTTPSPEPSLHFGTPPSATGLNNSAPTTLSEEESNQVYLRAIAAEDDDLEDTIDDSRAAEMRKAVIDWGLGANGPKQEANNWERQLAMMVMALTHPTRPTASQIAAQAEHIHSLLAERSDLSEFRHADRLSFERTAQALNARVTKGVKSNTVFATTNEALYLDERTQNAEIHARNERLHAENIRLERELKDAKREIMELRQSIEGLRVNLLISPRTPSSIDAQGAFHSATISPTPNPRGRPRKYPIPSPAQTPIFQPPTHSNSAVQLPISSMSVLNPGISFTSSGQPPPEKRMRPTQPDARAEFLLAAARRVGKDRVVEVLEGSELAKKDNLELSVETDVLQSLVHPRSHLLGTPVRELPSTTRVDQHGRRGRPPKASASFPSTARHQFNQFLVEEIDQPYSGHIRGTIMEPVGSLNDTSSANTQRYPPRSQPQQVIVAFTGDPQVDAQACLASFVAQYPGIRPTPTWRAGMGDVIPESGMAGELQETDPVGPTANKTSGAVQRTHSTPELAKDGSRNRGLENLLSAARTVLRARSRSTTPTPRRHLSSTSALSSPYRSSPRLKSAQSRANSGQTGPSQRRHSSPVVPLGDSDTEPEDSPKSRRVYSALDVLADQAAAARTSSPDPPGDARDSSPEPSTQPAGRPAPAQLSAFRPIRSTSLPGSSPDFSLPPSDFESPPVSLGVVDTRLEATSNSPFGGPTPEISDVVPNIASEIQEKPGDIGAIVGERMDNNLREPDTTNGQARSPELALRTPPRSQKSRGKQRA